MQQFTSVTPALGKQRQVQGFKVMTGAIAQGTDSAKHTVGPGCHPRIKKKNSNISQELCALLHRMGTDEGVDRDEYRAGVSVSSYFCQGL